MPMPYVDPRLERRGHALSRVSRAQNILRGVQEPKFGPDADQQRAAMIQAAIDQLETAIHDLSD